MELDLLVKEFQNKNIRAFNKLYDMYHENIYGVIFNIVKNKEISEEVLQDVFCKIWNNAQAYSSKKGRFFTWVLNIARNAAIDKVRSKDFKHSKENQKGSFFVDIIHSFDKTEFNIDLEYVKQVSLKLKDTCVAIINLIYFQGYKQKDVADELQIPLGTVKTNNRKCVLELRKLLVK